MNVQGNLSGRGRKIFRLCLELDKEFPIIESVFQRFRNVGPHTVKEFIKAGLVIPTVPGEFDSLSTRAYNCVVIKAEIKDKADVVKAINDGRLTPLKRPRDYGWKTHKEVCAWAGLPEPIRPSPVNPLPRCPTCGRVIY